MKAEQIETYAQTAYERYGDAVGWLAVGGHAMPAWLALPQRIQQAWCEAVRGALGLPPGADADPQARADLIAYLETLTR